MTSSEVAYLSSLRSIKEEAQKTDWMFEPARGIFENAPPGFFNVFLGAAPDGAEILRVDKKYVGHTNDPLTWAVRLFNQRTNSLQAVTSVAVGGDVLNLRIFPLASYMNQPPPIRDTIEGDLLQGKLNVDYQADEMTIVSGLHVTYTAVELHALSATTHELRQAS
jgi:hypothetical protein